MRNNKGITLIALISSIILIIIVAGMTITASVTAFNQMKFESAKAEIEEMQKLVDEIATDYKTYLNEKHEGSNNYVDYFNARYNADFQTRLLSQHLSEVKPLVDKFNTLGTSNDKVFLFEKNDIVKYFNLKGINDIVVDFSSRTVYSADGIKDPDDKDKIYYTQSDWNGDPKIKNTTSTPTTTTATVTQEVRSNSDYTFKITVNKTLKNISNLYAIYTKTGESTQTTTEITSFNITDRSSGNTVIKVSVTGEGTYSFKIVDSLKNVYVTQNITTSN